MPTVTQSDDQTVSKTSPGLIADEFLPKISLSNLENTNDVKYTLDETEDIQLSEYLDNGHRNNQTIVVTTSKENIELSFNVAKGQRDSDDEDGIIGARLSLEDPNIKIIDNKDFKLSYGSSFNLKLEIKVKEKKEFYIDFYAKDDTNDEWNVGELIDVFCGRVKIFREYINLKKIYYSISLMQETDYRSNNLNYFKNFIKVKNSAFTHLELGNYLAKQSEKLGTEENEYDGEEIKFLSIFSHGYENNIFGDSDDFINKEEIKTIFASESINFSDDAVIFLGACNAGTGLKNSFAQELANITDAKVIGMVNDGVAVVSESTGNSTAPKMIYGPKYGNKYNAKFYAFKKDIPPLLVSKEFDIIKLIDNLKSSE